MKKALGGAQSVYCSNKLEEKESPSAEATYSKWRVLKATSGHQVRGRNPSWTGCCTYQPSKLGILWLPSLLSVSGLWHLSPIATRISKFEGICLVWAFNALQSSGKCRRIGMRMYVWVGGSSGYVIRPTATVELLQFLRILLRNFSLLQISQLHPNGVWTSSPVPSHLSTFYYFYSLSHFQHMLQVCSTY